MTSLYSTISVYVLLHNVYVYGFLQRPLDDFYHAHRFHKKNIRHDILCATRRRFGERVKPFEILSNI